MLVVSYAGMRLAGVAPTKHTFPLLLKSISKSKTENPFHIFAQIVKFGFESDQFVINSLISAFASCGFIESARKVFDESSHKDVISWTAIIDGYIKNGLPVEALKGFAGMKMSGVRVDEGTVVSVLRAAGMVGDVWFGKWIHGFYVESGRIISDVYVGSALVDMYCKCGCCDDGRRVFDGMPGKNVVSWSALIAGYVQCSRCKDALIVFKDMLLNDVEPNESTLSSVLTACAQLGALDQGRWVHEYIDQNLIKKNSVLGTALIDMYAKCGCIDKAFLVFEKLPDKNLYPWTAMINGFAVHGDALSAVKLFSSMLRDNVVPNEVTFLSVLSACSHGGLVTEGRRIFKLMEDIYHLEPNIAHYGCMVDLLGRAGYLEEAKNLIENMTMEPSPEIWAALSNACIIHKAYELGEFVGKHLISTHPNHSGGYALLANMYSTCRKPEKAAEVRRLLKVKGVEKTPGCSWIEVNGVVHEFKAFDRLHFESYDVYVLLDCLKLQLKPADYILETDLLIIES